MKAALALAVALWAEPAAYKTANDWIDGCNSTRDMPTYYSDQAYCTGYVVGVADAMQESHPRVYIQPGVQVRQLISVAANWMRRQPEYRHRSAALVMGTAFAEAWPCPTADAPHRVASRLYLHPTADLVKPT
jgi:hypothetical protein